MINEVIRTSGDVRRMIAETMQEIRSGKIDASRGQTIAALAKELTASMQAEVNVAKINIQLTQAGMGVNRISSMGKLLIGDESTPTLNGISES
jgi:ABC-type bacteriocin/lantibiotic exporter with double-glycine peptidase domain